MIAMKARRPACPECRMDPRDGHVRGCPETPGSWEDARTEREVIPAECHQGGRITCAHPEHKMIAVQRG